MHDYIIGYLKELDQFADEPDATIEVRDHTM